MLLKLWAIVIVAFTHDANSLISIEATVEVDALLDGPQRRRPSPCPASDERAERYATGRPIGRQGARGAAPSDRGWPSLISRLLPCRLGPSACGTSLRRRGDGRCGRQNSRADPGVGWRARENGAIRHSS